MATEADIQSGPDPLLTEILQFVKLWDDNRQLFATECSNVDAPGNAAGLAAAIEIDLNLLKNGSDRLKDRIKRFSNHQRAKLKSVVTQ
jgi:hypothetical protein